MPSRFERDLADFHALDEAPQPVFQAELLVRRQPLSRGRETSIRLVAGVLGLFWAIVLCLIAVAMLVGAWAVIF